MNAIITYPNGTDRTIATFEELSELLMKIQEEDPTVILKLRLDFSDENLISDLGDHCIPDFELTPSMILPFYGLAKSLYSAYKCRYWKYVEALCPHPMLG